MSARGRALVGVAVAGAAWVALAGLRPGTTYHLAPAVIAWVYPYLRLTGAGPTRRETLVAVLIGGVAAVAVTGLLAVWGWLDGPALAGGTAAVESVIVAAAATVIGMVFALTRPGVRQAPVERSGRA